MTSAATIPAESDLLCEGCGYTLNGLPADSRCPECGRPMSETAGQWRVPPAWERETGSRRLRAFVTTTLAILFQPSRFFRTLATRTTDVQSLRFAQVHWLLSAVVLSLTTMAHNIVLNNTTDWLLAAVLVLPIFLGLWLTTYYAGRLTAWEAAYRGLRLPLPTVHRAMHYHTPHLLPVCLVALLTTGGYAWLWMNQIVAPTTMTAYLIVLCAEVIAGATYLFWTYWIAMRNVMFANR